jgi:hypothetical protein
LPWNVVLIEAGMFNWLSLLKTPNRGGT